MRPTNYVKNRIETRQQVDLELYKYIAEWLDAKGFDIAGFSVKESSDGGFGRKIDIQIKSLDKEPGRPLTGWPYFPSLSKERS